MKLLIDGDVLLYLALARDKEDNLEEAKEHYLGIIKDACESNFTTDAEVYLSSDGQNFRKNTYESYKANRKTKTPPPNLKELKEWVFGNVPNVFGSPKGEADDYLLMRASELGERGESWVIATVDKDLRTMPGIFYDLRQRERIIVSPRQAYNFMMQQFIMGDPVDSIPGIPGMGPKKTAALLPEHLPLDEQYAIVKETWKTEYDDPKTWKQELDSTFNCAFIRRRGGDLRPLAFARGSFDAFRKRLRIPVQHNEALGLP